MNNWISTSERLPEISQQPAEKKEFWIRFTSTLTTPHALDKLLLDMENLIFKYCFLIVVGAYWGALHRKAGYTYRTVKGFLIGVLGVFIIVASAQYIFE